jgi:hypothetical protein
MIADDERDGTPAVDDDMPAGDTSTLWWCCMWAVGNFGHFGDPRYDINSAKIFEFLIYL